MNSSSMKDSNSVVTLLLDDDGPIDNCLGSSGGKTTDAPRLKRCKGPVEASENTDETLLCARILVLSSS